MEVDIDGAFRSRKDQQGLCKPFEDLSTNSMQKIF
jgi:hypothetical protein